MPNPAPALSVESLATELARLESLIVGLLNTPRLHVKDVCLRYRISEATLYRWVSAGILPRPVRFYGSLWSLAELERAEAAGRLVRHLARHG